MSGSSEKGNNSKRVFLLLSFIVSFLIITLSYYFVAVTFMNVKEAADALGGPKKHITNIALIVFNLNPINLILFLGFIGIIILHIYKRVENNLKLYDLMIYIILSQSISFLFFSFVICAAFSPLYIIGGTEK